MESAEEEKQVPLIPSWDDVYLCHSTDWLSVVGQSIMEDSTTLIENEYTLQTLSLSNGITSIEEGCLLTSAGFKTSAANSYSVINAVAPSADTDYVEDKCGEVHVELDETENKTRIWIMMTKKCGEVHVKKNM